MPARFLNSWHSARIEFSPFRKDLHSPSWQRVGGAVSYERNFAWEYSVSGAMSAPLGQQIVPGSASTFIRRNFLLSSSSLKTPLPKYRRRSTTPFFKSSKTSSTVYPLMIFASMTSQGDDGFHFAAGLCASMLMATSTSSPTITPPLSRALFQAIP